ncbi:MAG TPA: aminoacetone oxidase family FAD-binding enzyme [Thermoanaerobaculia bacterium]|nr:aminoacetone oxidase family FAD-binding enzyme [Thermoanaerobaculia bacterium]
MKPDVVVVGGGAAGLLAALAAARGGRRVLALEAAKDAGRKILVSGGGRCNVLPMEDAPQRFVSESPNRLVRRFLDRWPLSEQRLFFEELLGAPLREEPESRKLFPPSNRAKDVRDALRRALAAAGGTLRAAAPVRDVARTGEGFAARLDGEEIAAPRVVLATGGLSVLAGGADAAGYAWAQAMGHTVRRTYPALVPLTGDAPAHHALAGVSLPARVNARSERDRASSSGGFLFTHRGWSGPAVLDVSHVVARAALAGASAEVRVCFDEISANGPERGPRGSGDGVLTGIAAREEKIASNGSERDTRGSQRGDAAAQWDAALRGAGRSAGSRSLSLLPFLRKSSLPDRLASLILEVARVPDIPLSYLSREARARVVETLTAFPLPATGTEGYRTAEVTGGGVALEDVDPGSGESRLVPGLFLAGEMLDAFGPIGGFNFQWAWATGRTAGEASARA